MSVVLRAATAVQRLSLIIILLAVWQLVSGVLFPRWAAHYTVLLPPPTLVLSELLTMTKSGALFLHVLKSLQRVLTAFAIAVTLAIPLGIAIGWWRHIDRVVDPVVEILRPIPPIAWIPLGILWFGIGDAQNVFIIFLGVLFPIIVNTITGVKGVDPVIIWGALTLGATQGQILREVILPGSLPFIITGLRVGLGVGWMCLVAAELVAAKSGVGYMIEDARFMLLTERVILGMLVIGLMGFLMDRGMRMLQRRLIPWYGVGR